MRQKLIIHSLRLRLRWRILSDHYRHKIALSLHRFANRIDSEVQEETLDAGRNVWYGSRTTWR